MTRAEDWMDWRTRFAMWRMDWFPYRVYEFIDGETWGPAVWMRPRRWKP